MVSLVPSGTGVCDDMVPLVVMCEIVADFMVICIMCPSYFLSKWESQ